MSNTLNVLIARKKLLKDILKTELQHVKEYRDEIRAIDEAISAVKGRSKQ